MNFNIGFIYFTISILCQQSFYISASAELVNQTFQIKFSNEKWDEGFSNSSSMDYIKKLLSIQSLLNNTLQNMPNISLVLVTNLTSSESNVVALTIIQSNGAIDKQQLNTILSSLNASLILTSTASTMSTNITTVNPSTTNLIVTPSTNYSSPTAIFTNSTINAYFTSNLTEAITTRSSSMVSTMANLSYSNTESSTQNSINITTSSYTTPSTVNNNSSVQFTGTTINNNYSSASNMDTTLSPNLNYTLTSLNTTTLNYTTIFSTLNYTTTVNPNSNTTTPNPNSNTTTINPNSNTTTSNPNSNTTTINPNSNTTTINPNSNTTTPNPNSNTTTSNPNSNTTTSNPNSNTTTSNPNSNLTTSSLNVTSTTSNTLQTTVSNTISTISTTTFSVPQNNLSIRFLNDTWKNDYFNGSSEEYKTYINVLLSRLSLAFKIESKFFTIYSLRPGSVIAYIGVFTLLNINEINNALVAMSAERVSSITTTAPSTIISTTISSGLPIYAVALISIFVIISILSLVFLIAAISLRHRRLKGYGRHQIDFFEMENGWNYSTRNTVYSED